MTRDLMRKATRQEKRLAKDRLNFLKNLGNGRKRAGEDLVDNFRTILRDIIRGR
tara:strand:+ start:13 stop:174 length:162 start_codon:yes stop_codon:yes gene_type:complete